MVANGAGRMQQESSERAGLAGLLHGLFVSVLPLGSAHFALFRGYRNAVDWHWWSEEC